MNDTRSPAAASGLDLWDALVHGATRADATLHHWDGRDYVANSWDDVVRDAERMTAGLRAAGVEPGTRVATILTNTPNAVRGILGTWLAGGAVASFPVPARGMSMDEYVDQLRVLCAHLEPSAMLVDEFMLPGLPEDLRSLANARSWESVVDSGKVEPAPPGADEVAFIQYSSGSTSMPKGCMLSPRAIIAQLNMVAEFLGFEAGSHTHVSWLPLSHDMGLFGNLLAPWAHRCNVGLSTPERFGMAPRTWFDDCAELGGISSCGTNTALHLAARAHKGRGTRVPLQLRSVVLGAERLEWATLERAVEALGPSGLRAENLMPAYGLAEATLAVTTTPMLEAPRAVPVDAVGLANGDVQEVDPDHESATLVVSSGTPCPGIELPGLDDDSLEEVVVRSPCLGEGYWGNEELTAERFTENGLRTGDLGFAVDGYLYPVGRADDVISIGGRKVYAREIEAGVDSLKGVRKGCSTVVERRNGERPRLTLLVELKDGHEDYDGLAEQAAGLAMSKAAVELSECVFLEKGALPKTPSGKIQRYRCRHLLDEDRLAPVASVELG
ncbi:MAG: AMP-binding protein [Actinomycetota bacterium]|nr:AMP-binding protein [Actinomycetota bacterium]